MNHELLYNVYQMTTSNDIVQCRLLNFKNYLEHLIKCL